ncbi:glycoside hydrolase family 24 protein [Asaia astilbis]|uniref:glycoside hydrolase family 24 protein n=1 Tax=Asaia astilbis TaxID=610244 RepID=UPI00046E9864|nr:glycoside hydrolase family 104 protein [Asaia astilbis]
MPRLIGLTPNQSAFLHMITVSEIGHPLMDVSDEGYNVVVGSTVARPYLFRSYATHPMRFNPAVKSDAAGAYQVMGRYWAYYKKYLQLLDFSPASQDRIAICLINECKAMPAIEAGDIEKAIHLTRSRWASFPGAGYGQNEHAMDFLIRAYQEAHGRAAA